MEIKGWNSTVKVWLFRLYLRILEDDARIFAKLRWDGKRRSCDLPCCYGASRTSQILSIWKSNGFPKVKLPLSEFAPKMFSNPSKNLCGLDRCLTKAWQQTPQNYVWHCLLPCLQFCFIQGWCVYCFWNDSPKQELDLKSMESTSKSLLQTSQLIEFAYLAKMLYCILFWSNGVVPPLWAKCFVTSENSVFIRISTLQILECCS